MSKAKPNLDSFQEVTRLINDFAQYMGVPAKSVIIDQPDEDQYSLSIVHNNPTILARRSMTSADFEQFCASHGVDGLIWFGDTPRFELIIRN